MNRIISAALVALALAGCQSTSSSTNPSPATASTAAAPSERAALVGSWSGALSNGSMIAVTVPESGNPTYRFKGSNVPVRAASMSGNSLVLTVGSGGGTVRLTPQGDQLGFAYSFRGDRASTTLSRS